MGRFKFINDVKVEGELEGLEEEQLENTLTNGNDRIPCDDDHDTTLNMLNTYFIQQTH